MYNLLSQNRISGPSATFYRHFDQGRGLLQKAVELDEKLKFDSSKETVVEAVDTYKKVLEFFNQAQKMSSSLDMQQLTPEERRKFVGNLEKLNQFLPSVKDRYNTLNQKLAQCDNVPTATTSRNNRVPQQGLPQQASVNRTTPRMPRIDLPLELNRVPRSELLRGVDKKFGEKLLDEVLDSTGVSLCDISGCAAAKTALEEAVLLPSLNPRLFSGLRQPVKGILLFGPPGNGKTMLAKAVATDTRQTFFNISASSLTSKWVGEGEKTVRTLFQMARNAQPCIIFIDEIDSILCSRTENEAESSRRLKTEFLVQFDGATSNSTERILVIGATNRPQELDDAVLRRFPKRIFIPLPDDASRYSAIKSILNKHGMSRGLTDSEYKYVASRTSGYSYADLFAVCQEAAMVPVRSIDKKNLAKTTASQLRPLKLSDFDHAVSVIRPSTNVKNHEGLQEFANRAGQSS